jgi:hypothetical protein
MSFKLSRDPALWLFLVATGVRLLAAYGPWTITVDVQAAVNALATAIASFIVAAIVVRDKQVPALLGIVQALIALAVGLGLRLDPEMQALIMSGVGGLVAAFVRTQVVAPVSAVGDRQA